MRVSCAIPREYASDDFLEQLQAIGASPILTDYIVRVVYEGSNRYFGEAIMDIFSGIPDHEITVYFTDEELKGYGRRRTDSKRRSSRRLRDD